MTERWTFILPGGVPMTIPKPEQRLEEAKRLAEKYLKPKIEVEKITLKFEPKDWLPVVAGICAFILLLRVIK